MQYRATTGRKKTAPTREQGSEVRESRTDPRHGLGEQTAANEQSGIGTMFVALGRSREEREIARAQRSSRIVRPGPLDLCASRTEERTNETAPFRPLLSLLCQSRLHLARSFALSLTLSLSLCVFLFLSLDPRMATFIRLPQPHGIRCLL